MVLDAVGGVAPAIRGRDDYRQLIAAGRVVAGMVAVGQLLRNGTVEVLQLTVSLEWPEDPEVDPGSGSDDE